MRKPTPTRRSLLGIIAGAPMLALPTLARANSDVSANSAAWDRAAARFSHANGRAKAVSAAYDRAYAAAQAEIGAKPDASQEVGFGPFKCTVDSGNARQELERRTHLAAHSRYYPDDIDREIEEAAKRIIAAEKAWFDRVAEIETKHGIDRIGDLSDKVWDASTDAELAAMRIPAPHVGGLLWKLERLFGADQRTSEGYCDSIAGEMLDLVLADARRLTGEARS